MRHVPRGDEPAPKALSAKSNGKSELECAQEHYKDPYDPKTGSYPFAVYKKDEVKKRLDQLFHGKCAYCETFYASSAPVDIEHYRPKGAVEGEPDHNGYWWLAMDWENLLPSCIDCNRRRHQTTPRQTGSLEALEQGARFQHSRVMLSGKKDLFPITEGATRAVKENDDLQAEGALLLNPCHDDPSEHLLHHVDPAMLIGLVLPKPEDAGAEAALPAAAPAPAEVALGAAAAAVSVRGAVSIQVYGLNRLGLVQDRTRVLRRLEFLEMMTVELAGIIQTLETHSDPEVAAAVRKLQTLKQNTISEINEMAADRAPYSSMAKAYIEGMRARLSA